MFLSPFMLFGAAAAGIPIALHFFFRSRYRTVPWAAMKFLLDSIEQTSRRLRFQELLLLILRTAILLLLALAFARPLTSLARGAGGGDAVDAVFVFDVSYSMGAADGAKSRLERATEAAADIIDKLPAHSTVQIITCGDRATLIGPSQAGNLEQARDRVHDLKLTSLATDLYPGVVEANSAMATGQASNKELYIFSDMQALGWDHQAANLNGMIQDLHSKAVIHLVRCGTRPVSNVAVTEISPQAGTPRPTERVGYAIVVRNTGSDTVRDVKVSLSVDENEKAVETTALPPLNQGEARAVTLSAKFDKPGLHVLTARLAHDDMEGDNRFDQVVNVLPQVNILVVDGSPSERNTPQKASSFYLMHGLLPVKDTQRGKTYFEPHLVTPNLASPTSLVGQDICILSDVALPTGPKGAAGTVPMDFVEELGRFVRSGHGLIIFGGDNVHAEPYNRLLGKKLGLLPLPIKGIVKRTEKEPLLMDRASANLATYWIFKDDKNYADFGNILTWKALELTEPKIAPKAGDHKDPNEPKDAQEEKEPVTVAMRYNNGAPAIVARKVDGGEVLLVTTAAGLTFAPKSSTPSWTDWALHKTQVPFVHLSIAHLLHGQSQTYNLIAGQTLHWFPTEKSTLAYTLVKPDGKQERLGLPDTVGNRTVVVAKELPSAGVYHLKSGPPANVQDTDVAADPSETPADKGIPLAVIPDLCESENLQTLTDEQIDQRLGFTPIHITAGLERGTPIIADRLNREWTLWLLTLVLLLVLVEPVLAYVCGRAW